MMMEDDLMDDSQVKRLLGISRFIGELYNKGLFKSKTVKDLLSTFMLPPITDADLEVRVESSYIQSLFLIM